MTAFAATADRQPRHRQRHREDHHAEQAEGQTQGLAAAVGPASDPQLPPFFVTAGRAACAGLLAAIYLLVVRAPRPGREHRLALAVSALGTVVGFPLLLSLALRRVDAMHAAVITGVLPLATALAAARR